MITIGGIVGVSDKEAITAAWFNEITTRNAWISALNAKPQMTLVDHAGNEIARTGDGSLLVTLQEQFIVAQAKLADRSIAAERMRSGAYVGFSVVYRVKSETWTDDFMKRTVSAIDLDGSKVCLEWADSSYRSRLGINRCGYESRAQRKALAGSLLGLGCAEMHAGIEVFSEAELEARAALDKK